MSFERLSDKATSIFGSPVATVLAFVSIVVWAACGPFLGFSEIWQLSINTATTIITFLMVFIIQSSQNRNDARLHMKLDELIHSIDSADDSKADE